MPLVDESTFNMDDWAAAYIEASDLMLGQALGYDLTSYRNVGRVGVDQFTSRWTSDLQNLQGYYDQSKVNSLIGSLGGTSSQTYLNQLQALSQQANKVYSYIQNPDSITSTLQAYADKVGYEKFLGMQTGYMPKRTGKPIHMSGGYYSDIMGNRTDVLMSPTMSRLYDQVDRIKGYQDTLAQQLSAQQQKENNFVTQISQITQQATLAKTKAEQQAAQQKLAAEQKAAQDALNRQAQENAAKLAEQERQQKAQFEAAQRQAEENARKQQLALDTTAQVTALKNASAGQQAAAQVAVSQLEQQASTTRGGEAIVSTNANTAKKQRGVTSRTERWQSTRQPAPGGGGIRA